MGCLTQNVQFVITLLSFILFFVVVSALPLFSYTDSLFSFTHTHTLIITSIVLVVNEIKISRLVLHMLILSTLAAIEKKSSICV